MKIKILIMVILIAQLSTNSAFAEESNNLPTNNQFSEITLQPSSMITSTNDFIADNNADSSNVLLQAGANQEIITTDKTDTNESNNLTPYQNWVKDFSDVFTLRGGLHRDLIKQETQGSEEKTVVKQWLDGDYATGRWFGMRPMLEDHGVTINSGLLYSPATKTGGGLNGENSTKGYSLFNLSVSVDTQKAGAWKGGTFYALYQRKTGYGISGPNGDGSAMGDWMGLDGWDWRQINQISELWYQQKLFGEKLRLKVGKQDANTDFGYLNCGWDFINTAFSVNPTTPMPTYPDQSFGFVAEVNPNEHISIRNGIYSRYNTPFNITEILVKPKTKLPGRYMIGAWEMSDSNGYDVASGVDPNDSTLTTYNTYNRNFGAYVGFEQMIYKEKKNDENDMQGLTLFTQAGISPSYKNDMSKYIGAGLHYIGPIPKRDKDRAGIAIANGSFATRLNNLGADEISRCGSETVFEAFYRVQFNPWFYLQPDVQLIMNPGGAYSNSVAIGLRSVITF